MPPIYLKNKPKLKKAAEHALGLLENCRICPRKCAVNRLKNQKGFCQTGYNARVYSYMPHRGEEPAISGERGSGTIFFSGCNLKCAYCQNFEFSQSENGSEAEAEILAKYMLDLQENRCHNINLVTPTHVLPQILNALTIAVENGLNIPIVYNTGGYELKEMIFMLDGIVDIYLPDMRYGENASAVKYSAANDYAEFNFSAVQEMFRQAGTGDFDRQGLLIRGLIIRHLVLPGNISASEKIFRFISQELSKDTYISLMSQYTPFYNARKFPGINRRLSVKEYEHAKELMDKYGLHNGWVQEEGGLADLAGVNIRRNTWRRERR